MLAHLRITNLKIPVSLISCASRNIVSSSELPANEPFTDLTNPCVRTNLEEAVAKVNGECKDCPIIIAGQQYRTDHVKYQVAPHDHSQQVAKFYYANESLISKAVETAIIGREKWENTSYDTRKRIILRSASLVATKYRYANMAACMIGQGKTAIQADIDVIAELIDFLKFNVVYGEQILASPPLNQVDNVLNSVTWRGLEGFVAAITPFNFSAIGGNLASAPALMGNTVLWKPSDTAVLSNYLFYEILLESGMPEDVISFIPCDGPTFGNIICHHRDLAGITFTGSSNTFKSIWKEVGKGIDNYKTFPKVVGECGGKNYHFVHTSADVDSVVNGTIRSGFEYSGQKCSACSRMYVPDTLWPEVCNKLVSEMAKIKVGRTDDYSSFLSAVIDEISFKKIMGYLDHAKANPDHYEILSGGECDGSVGYFVEPTLIRTKDPHAKLLNEEIFGPVVTAYVYSADATDDALDLVASTSPYALTGSVFSLDRSFVNHASRKLRHTAGNFYVNDKSTGSVVGQQPFGGARGSGTNDKAGMGTYLQKWVSPQAVKEGLSPLPHWSYPYMGSK